MQRDRWSARRVITCVTLTAFAPFSIRHRYCDGTYDRGDKFAHYRRLDPLQEYVLIAQDRVRVEHYIRRGEQWILTELNNPDDVLRLTSVACEISLREIYARVEFAST